MNKKLDIVSVNQPEKKVENVKSRRKQAEKKYEALWKHFPDRLNPERNGMERMRIERSVKLIEKHLPVEKLQILDIGCGDGTLTNRLSKGTVEGVDIAEEALSILKKNYPEINTRQDALPETALDDDAYDLCLSSDVIAELHPKDRRLAMAELGRLIKQEGVLFISTPIDYRSEDALQRFVQLVETEFKPIAWKMSFHSFTIKLLNLFKAPHRYFRGWKEPDYGKLRLEGREGFSRFWTRFNQQIGWLWFPLKILFYPFVYLLEQQETVIRFMEKLCCTLKGESGITHLMVMAKRRPLEDLDEEEEFIPPDRKPFKKEMKWE